MNMKKLLLLGTVAVATFAMAQDAKAVDETGNASAFIQNPLTLTEDTALDFATINADTAGDTVTLTAANSISSTGTSTFSGTTVPGEFSATGTPNANVTITYTAGTLTGPGTAMAINNFTNNAGGTPALDGTGNLTFNVGADLVVGANQVGGAYSGTYTVTVNY